MATAVALGSGAVAFGSVIINTGTSAALTLLQYSDGILPAAGWLMQQFLNPVNPRQSRPLIAHVESEPEVAEIPHPYREPKSAQEQVLAEAARQFREEKSFRPSQLEQDLLDPNAPFPTRQDAAMDINFEPLISENSDSILPRQPPPLPTPPLNNPSEFIAPDQQGDLNNVTEVPVEMDWRPPPETADRYRPGATLDGSQGTQRPGNLLYEEDNPVYPDPASRNQPGNWYGLGAITAAVTAATTAIRAKIGRFGLADSAPRENMRASSIDSSIGKQLQAVSAAGSQDLRSIIRDYELPPSVMPFLLSATAMRDTNHPDKSRLITDYIDEFEKRNPQCQGLLQMCDVGDGSKFVSKFPLENALAVILWRNPEIPDIENFDPVNLRTAMGAYILGCAYIINRTATKPIPALQQVSAGLCFKTQLRLLLAALQYFRLPPLRDVIPNNSDPITKFYYGNFVEILYTLVDALGLTVVENWKAIPGTSQDLKNNSKYRKCFIATRSIRVWHRIFEAATNDQEDLSGEYRRFVKDHPDLPY